MDAPRNTQSTPMIGVNPWADATSLVGLDRMRQPFDRPNRRIVRAVLDRHLSGLSANDELVEIGCGLGQLRNWLPETLRDRVIHTEPSPAFLDEFRRRHPGARARKANAFSLPGPPGSLHAILGLCAFDTLDDPARARDEIRRVLAPGGRFIHFLDLGTDLGTLFRELVAEGQVPFPNFLGEDAPGTGQFDDLLLTPRAELARLLKVLERERDPAAPRLRSHIQQFTPPAFDPVTAAQRFMALVSDGPALAATNEQLRGVWSTVRRGAGLAFPLVACSSVGRLRGKVERLFLSTDGFVIEFSDFVTARETAPRGPDVHASGSYLARRVGQTFSRAEVPSEVTGVPVTALERVTASSWITTPADSVVIDSTMYVFVAVRKA
jgi:SAM-dependent methyltransferase